MQRENLDNKWWPGRYEILCLRCSLGSNKSKLGLPQKKSTPQSTLRQCWEQLVSFSIEVEVLKSFLPEKKLMPMIVLTASIIYVGIAATFYFDVIWILTKLKRELNYFCSCSIAQLHIAQEASEDCEFILHSCPTQFKSQNEINRPWHLLILTYCDEIID